MCETLLLVAYLHLVVVGLIVLSLFFSMLLAFGGESFSSRYTKAGYEGAELELCIKRVKEGLPVYKENIEKWNKGY